MTAAMDTTERQTRIVAYECWRCGSVWDQDEILRDDGWEARGPGTCEGCGEDGDPVEPIVAVSEGEGAHPEQDRILQSVQATQRYLDKLAKRDFVKEFEQAVIDGQREEPAAMKGCWTVCLVILLLAGLIFIGFEIEIIRHYAGY